MKKTYKILLLSIFYLFLELSIFLFVNNSQFKTFFYSKKLLSNDSYNDLLLKRDKLLGWPERNENFSEVGFLPRTSPIYKNYCFSLYGDSFAYSADVEEQFSWSEVTASRLECNVSNFAIGGYGLYQSFLRYKVNSNHDKSKIIVLNHTSENIARILNQYRELIYQNQINGFKPTVYLNENYQLQHVPIVNFKSYDDYVRNIKKISKLKFNYEYYLPEYNFSNFDFKFPFTYNFSKALFNHHRIKDKLNKRPWYSQHYFNKEDVLLTYKIIEEFIKLAKHKNKLSIITIMPTCRDFQYFKNNNEFIYKPLTNLLTKNNIYHIDFGMELMKKKDSKNFKKWFTKCSGHPNEYGYKLISDIFVESVKKNIVF